MASLIEELITLLKNEKENYEQLLVLAEEKVKIITSNDIEMLQKITAAESTIIGRNQKLDQKREQCVKSIGIVLNRNPEELTLTVIAEILPNKDESESLTKIKNELKTVLEALKLKNEQNHKLIESSLDYIDFSINLIRQGIEGDGYLSPIGEVVQEGKNFFDAKQ
jgi:flagellar biosynthesis/type III secretory pathway chaperone